MSGKYAPPKDANINPHERIDYFRGVYGFLSNMHSCSVHWKGITYPSSEHAFVASKIKLTGKLGPILARIGVAKIKSPAEAKKFGKTIILYPEWKEEQFEIMKDIVWAKFEQNYGLAKKLIDTGQAELIEGNTWWDLNWGMCNGQGQNRLGQILMEIRDICAYYFEK